MFDYTKYDPDSLDYIEICSIVELSEGEKLFLEVDDRQIVLFRINGDYFAVDDICSHDDGPLGEGDLEGYNIICPRHGARFDIRNGKAVSLPAVIDIRAYPVRIRNNNIEIGFLKT